MQANRLVARSLDAVSISLYSFGVAWLLMLCAAYLLAFAIGEVHVEDEDKHFGIIVALIVFFSPYGVLSILLAKRLAKRNRFFICLSGIGALTGSFFLEQNLCWLWPPELDQRVRCIQTIGWFGFFLGLGLLLLWCFAQTILKARHGSHF
jgi:hypothetical protein